MLLLPPPRTKTAQIPSVMLEAQDAELHKIRLCPQDALNDLREAFAHLQMFPIQCLRKLVSTFVKIYVIGNRWLPVAPLLSLEGQH